MPDLSGEAFLPRPADSEYIKSTDKQSYFTHKSSFRDCVCRRQHQRQLGVFMAPRSLFDPRERTAIRGRMI
jgi:hypothetical protein